jgi:hypothetical protein
MSDLEGFVNDVILHGKISNKNIKDLGNDKKMFRAKIDNIKIVAWDSLAEKMDNQVSNGDIVKVHGVINERSYKSNCRNCNNEFVTYWTDVEIYKFTKENE